MRINALGNTATDFASDDYIAIDGATNGSRKMKNDSLLEVTAQNALAGNVAPAFDSNRDITNPYKVGESVVYKGKVYTFKVEHYGAWNSSDVYANDVFDKIDRLSTTDNKFFPYFAVKQTPTRILRGKYLTSSGTEANVSTFTIQDYVVKGLKKLFFHALTGAYGYVWYYAEDGSAISSFTGGANVFEKVITIPSNAALMRVSASNSEEVRIENIYSEEAIEDVSKTSTNKCIGPLYIRTTDGKYLNSSGQEGDLASYEIVDYFVSGVKRCHIFGVVGTSGYIWFYDKNLNPISSKQGASGVMIDEIFIPDGAFLMRVSHSKTKIFFVFGTSPIVNELNGKKIGIVGDSIAYGSSSGDAKYSFIGTCGAMLGMSVNNVAVGGSQFCDHENTGVYRQVNNLDSDVDIVVVFAGTNDFGHAAPIGEVYTTAPDGTRAPSTDYQTTTCGGINKVISDIYTKFGYKPIVLCTAIQRKLAGAYSSGGSWSKNDINKYLVDYNEAIKSCGEFWGIPVFDAFKINMQPMVDAANSYYFADGLHPNKKGHVLLGKSLAKYISNLYIDDYYTP